MFFKLLHFKTSFFLLDSCDQITMISTIHALCGQQNSLAYFFYLTVKSIYSESRYNYVLQDLSASSYIFTFKFLVIQFCYDREMELTKHFD